MAQTAAADPRNEKLMSSGIELLAVDGTARDTLLEKRVAVKREEQLEAEEHEREWRWQ